MGYDGATAREMIRKDLGRAPSQIFRHFEESPLSAASIGQVHACVLPDGREAVIKLQRPDIRERMTTDLRIMHRLGSLLPALGITVFLLFWATWLSAAAEHLL